MTPIFSRSCLMNTTAVLERAMPPVNFRSAWLIRRDIRRPPAVSLRVRDDRQTERGLATRLRSVNLRDTAAGDAAHADSRIKVDRARRNRVDADPLVRPETHDRALPAALFDLGD